MAILPRGSSPDERPLGIVGAVASVDRDPTAPGRHAGIVDRVFGPGASSRGASNDSSPAAADQAPRAPIQPQYAEIDVDFSLGEAARKRTSVLGAAAKVAGDLVADENIEIEGLVEGAVRVRRARVTVGREGFVHARIDARTIRISGTVRGDVVAEDWVEIKPGGVVHGDVRAPRVILHDGAVVTGRLDMTRAAAARRGSQQFDPLVIPKRPSMRKVGKKPRARARTGDAKTPR